MLFTATARWLRSPAQTLVDSWPSRLQSRTPQPRGKSRGKPPLVTRAIESKVRCFLAGWEWKWRRGLAIITPEPRVLS